MSIIEALRGELVPVTFVSKVKDGWVMEFWSVGIPSARTTVGRSQ